MMTRQEIFDTVARHLIAQGKQSSRGPTIGEKSGCLYRGPNGLKCAVGVLIDDADYNPDMEGKSANLPIVRDALSKKVSTLHMPLVAALQETHDKHDSWTYPTTIVAALRGVADQFALSKDVLRKERKS